MGTDTWRAVDEFTCANVPPPMLGQRLPFPIKYLKAKEKKKQKQRKKERSLRSQGGVLLCAAYADTNFPNAFEKNGGP